MVSTAAIDTLRETLRGEQSQLEAWVRESMAAVESLHAELADWERELKRRESDLDHRETELAKAAANRESGFAAELRELRLLVEQQAKT